MDERPPSSLLRDKAELAEMEALLRTFEDAYKALVAFKSRMEWQPFKHLSAESAFSIGSAGGHNHNAKHHLAADIRALKARLEDAEPPANDDGRR